MTWTPLRTSSNCSLIRIGPVTRQQGGPFHVVLCFSEDVFSTARPEHSELRVYHPLPADSLLLERLVSWFSGRETKIHLYTDRSGARGFLQRKGVGRLRHLSCRVLWLQTTYQRLEETFNSVWSLQSDSCRNKAFARWKDEIADDFAWHVQYNEWMFGRFR